MAQATQKNMLEDTGLVKILITEKVNHRWRIYNNDPNHEDIKHYREIGKKFFITENEMIRIPQGHSANIRVVSKEIAGEGIVRPEIDGKYDGAITNEKNIMLCTLQADCTPVFILDPVKKAIAMVHSGWRGTVSKISINAINLMKEKYGTNISDILVYFGPSICKNCYEVDDDLIPEFKKILSDDELKIVFGEKKLVDGSKKYLLDVTEAIRFTLIKEGVKEKNIERSRYCTFHDNIYASFRRDRSREMQMLTAIMLV